MKPMSDKKDRKIWLGKRTEKGYKYKAKVDFGEDLSAQISKLIKEKKANEIIKEKVGKLRKIAGKEFSPRRKNTQYYYKIGKELLFIDSNLFRNISPNSIFRRIIEELPEVFLEKNAHKHLSVMYELAHVRKIELPKVSWGQWYEIGKFGSVCKDKNLLKQILKECKNRKLSGPTLRKRIEEIRKQKVHQK